MHTEKINESWVMYTTISGWICSYDLFTHKGKYRGGKIYDVDKKYIVLSWRCELIREVKGEDRTAVFGPDDGIFEIDAHTPHIFYFSEDTRMIEWFSDTWSSVDFERYRNMKK